MEKPEVLKNFYVIEGPDGSGKSSIIEEFKKNKWNKDLYFTSDPSHTEFGEGIRELMNKTKLVPEAIYHLLVADRIQTIDQIRKELANNKICIMDRYLWSAQVYGGSKHYELCKDLPRPAAYFYIKIDAKTSLERQQKRGERKIDEGINNFFEPIEKIQSIIDKYNEVANNEKDTKVYTIDGNYSITENYKKIEYFIQLQQ